MEEGAAGLVQFQKNIKFDGELEPFEATMDHYHERASAEVYWLYESTTKTTLVVLNKVLQN